DVHCGPACIARSYIIASARAGFQISNASGEEIRHFFGNALALHPGDASVVCDDELAEKAVAFGCNETNCVATTLGWRELDASLRPCTVPAQPQLCSCICEMLAQQQG